MTGRKKFNIENPALSLIEAARAEEKAEPPAVDHGKDQQADKAAGTAEKKEAGRKPTLAEDPGKPVMPAPEESSSYRPLVRKDKGMPGYRYVRYVEPKSKRLTILIQPSLLEAVRQTAKADGISVNESISEAIREYVEKGGQHGGN